MTYTEARAILYRCNHANANVAVSIGKGDPIQVCCDCWNRHVYAHRQARREQLAAAPRCEIDGCTARGAWTCLGVLLCGRHWRKVGSAHIRNTSSIGALGIFAAMDYTPAMIRHLAQEQPK